MGFAHPRVEVSSQLDDEGNLFTALEIATDQVTGLWKSRHRHRELLAPLEHLARVHHDCGDGLSCTW